MQSYIEAPWEADSLIYHTNNVFRFPNKKVANFFMESFALFMDMLIKAFFVCRHRTTMLVMHLSVAIHDGRHSCNGLHHFPAFLLLLSKVKGARPARFAVNVFRVDLIVQDGESALNCLIRGLNASLIEPVFHHLGIRVVVVGEAAA